MPESDGEAVGLVDVADRVAAAPRGDQVSIEDIVTAIGRQAFGPLILVFALIALSPVGAIPGASIVLGALIILLAVQIVFGRETPWFPKRLLRIHIGSDKARSSVDRLKPYFVRIDKIIRPRWQRLFQPPSAQFVALLCIALAVLMYPLALVPGGVAAPAFAICVLSLGLSSRDGIVLAAGFAVSAGAVAVSAYLLL